MNRCSRAALLAACLLMGWSCAREDAPAKKPFRFQGGEQVTVGYISSDILSRFDPYPQQVTSDGFVSAPMGAGAVNILDKTLQEATDAIATKVTEATGLKNPKVSISIHSITSRFIYLQGEVARPQKLSLPADRDLSLAAALADAGGVTADADVSQIKLIREGDEKDRVVIVNGSTFFRPGSSDVGPILRSGDLIVVPRAESFVLMGEIVKPGILTRKETRVQPGQPVRLSHAIAAAGGLKLTANKKEVRIVHTTEDNQRKVIVCDVEAAMDKGDMTQDPILGDGDQISVTASEGILLMGRVGQPGVYYPVGGAMTVSKLIALGGGFGQYAKKNSIIVVRKDRSGPPLRVDMRAVLEEGKVDQDVKLDIGDTVFVGESGL
ncbi:MAG: SLBB domain-containing protein [Planctomycetota bacterium]|nr:SLBB domain-containing protein [Planctomycetota bacterium]